MITLFVIYCLAVNPHCPGSKAGVAMIDIPPQACTNQFTQFPWAQQALVDWKQNLNNVVIVKSYCETPAAEGD